MVIVEIKTEFQATNCEWTCPNCSNTNTDDPVQSSNIEQCANCDFRLPEDIWTNTDEIQEIYINEEED